MSNDEMVRRKRFEDDEGEAIAPIHRKRIPADSIRVSEKKPPELVKSPDKTSKKSRKGAEKPDQGGDKKPCNPPDESDSSTPRKVYLRTGFDCKRAINCIYNEIRQNKISTDKGRTLIYCLRAMFDAIELCDFERKIKVMQKRMGISDEEMEELLDG